MATIVATRCAGAGHTTLTVTEAWGVHTIHGNSSALLGAAKLRTDSDLLEDVKKVVKQSGASTPAQVKAAIEAATYQDTSSDPAARDLGEL